MNVGFYLTKTYENNLCSGLLENKPNSNPIQSQYKPNSRKARMDVSLAITRNYNNEQRTMNNELLCKTNPTCRGVLSGDLSGEAGSFVALAKKDSEDGSFSEDGSLGEGGFKRGTYAVLWSVVLTEDKFRRNDNIKNLCALCSLCFRRIVQAQAEGIFNSFFQHFRNSWMREAYFGNFLSTSYKGPRCSYKLGCLGTNHCNTDDFFR